MNHEPLRRLVQLLTECLVSRPEDIRIEINHRSDRVFVYINSHRADVGRLVGQGGKNAKSIKNLVEFVTQRDAKWAKVTILEGWVGEKGTSTTLAWTEVNHTATKNRLEGICEILFPDARIQDDSDNRGTILKIRTTTPVPPECEGALRDLFKAYGASRGRFISVTVAKHESLAA